MNVLFERRFVEKSHKITSVFATTSMTSVVSIAFTLVTLSTSVEFAILEDKNETSSTSVEFAIFENKNEIRTEIKSMNAKKNDEFNDTSDKNDEINEFIAKSTIQTRVKLASFTKSLRMIQQFFHVIVSKRKRNVTNEKKRDEHRNKVARVMMTFLFENLDTFDNEK